MRKLYSITVRGKNHKWSFSTYIDPKHLKDYREDELEIDELLNTIPEFIVNSGFTREWVFLQDLWNFKNPFKNDNVINRG